MTIAVAVMKMVWILSCISDVVCKHVIIILLDILPCMKQCNMIPI